MASSSAARPVSSVTLLDRFLDNVLQEKQVAFRNSTNPNLGGYHDSESFRKAIAGAVQACTGTASNRKAEKMLSSIQPYCDRTVDFASGLRNVQTTNDHASFLLAVSLHMISAVLDHPAVCETALERIHSFGSNKMANTEMPTSVDYVSNSTLPEFTRTLYENYLEFAYALTNFVREEGAATGRFNRDKRLSKHAAAAMDGIANLTGVYTDKFVSEVTNARRVKHDLSIRTGTTNIAGQVTVTDPALNRTVRKAARNTVNLPRKVKGSLGEFFGRIDALQAIGDCFNITAPNLGNTSPSTSDDEPVTCVIWGMGAVGKTRLAQEYASKATSEFDWVLWANAEDSPNLMASYNAFAKKLKIATGESNSMELVRDWLETTEERWLLVFDNVEEWENIAKFVPEMTVSGGCILVTTQKSADQTGWSENFVKLMPFDSQSASELLLMNLEITDDETRCKDLALEITDIIGGLPLYLNQARGFMKSTKSPSKNILEEYLDSIQRTSIIPRNETVDKNLGYSELPNAAFDLTFERLDDDTRALLHILAFLHPDAIPEDMLFFQNHPGRLDFLDFNKKLEMTGALSTYQLAERHSVAGESCLSIHRSLQRAILDKLNREPEKRQLAFGRALQLLKAVLPEASLLQQPDDKQWTAIEKFLPHIQSLEAAYSRARPKMSGSFELADVCARFGMDLYDKGLIRVGEVLMRTAEGVLDDIGFDRSSSLRTNIHICVGMYTDTLGITRRNEGLERRIKALDLREEALRNLNPSIEEDILLHNAVMDLSCSYQQFNRFDKVEALSKRCLARFETWGKPEQYPYEFAKYYHSMAFVYAYRKMPKDAVVSAETGKDLMKTAAPGTLLTTVYRFDWAIFKFQDGQVDEAIAVHEEILQERITRCGKKNALTLQSYMTLGIMYYFGGMFEAAERHFREVLIHCQKVYWPHENVARAKYYLSKTLRQTNGRTSSIPPNISFTSQYIAAKSSPQNRLALESLTRDALADVLEEEAKLVLDGLLPQQQQQTLMGTLEGEAREAVAYDYMAPWGYRVVVQQTL